LNSGPPQPLSAEVESGSHIGIDELAWWRALRDQGDVTARERLLELHLPYARVVAATYYARRTHDEVEFSDYLQLARLGLVESLGRFDPDQGAQFRTFAARRMHGAILNGLERATEKTQQIAARKRVQQERLKTAKAMARERVEAAKSPHADALLAYVSEVGIGLAIGILLEGSGMIDGDAFGLQPVPSAEDVYAQHADHQRTNRQLLAAVSRLSVQEQVVVRRHYLQDHPFEQIATHLGLSKGRISQIHKAALQKLRESLNKPPGLDVLL
jgi:RNA polymerase sigma factor FliA